jgi:hypothetical protein
MTTARKIIGYLGYITVFVAVSFGASMVAHPAADTTPAPAHTATKAAVTCTDQRHRVHHHVRGRTPRPVGCR